jgi:tetratricopeptide (TPR) repeat protein
MYYGQLIGGHDALQAFKNGITCMLKTRASIVDKQKEARARALANAFTMGEHESEQTLAHQLQAIDKQISSGYTSMAELYVTDCCDDEGAERECEKLLQLALASCNDNPDALYASANLRTIQGRVDDATELMQRCLAVLEACRARSIENMGVLALAANPDQQHEDDPVQAAINLYDVSYELRVACAKLALELNLVRPAYTVLTQLLEEDDRVIEVSHLAAVCAHDLGEFRAALAHIERATELLNTEESDANMGGGSGEGGDDEDEQEQEEELDESQQASQAQEIATTKQALAELRAQCIEGAKTQPEGDDDEEDGGEEDAAAEAAAPVAAAAAAAAPQGDAMAE